ncbi:MAG: hypothetical protein GC186_17640 [Rhodobacteraceae bacterium]|nr:hypothetical protein [Paracoccaceae bacterium]
MTPNLRHQMFMFCAALLYFGAMLAGLAGYSWHMVPTFVALFLMWLAILHPEQMPQTAADWLRPRIIARVTLRVATQVALVVFCFGLGRGVGGILGTLPHLPLGLTVGVSFLALPFLRLLRTEPTLEAQKA